MFVLRKHSANGWKTVRTKPVQEGVAVHRSAHSVTFATRPGEGAEGLASFEEWLVKSTFDQEILCALTNGGGAHAVFVQTTLYDDGQMLRMCVDALKCFNSLTVGDTQVQHEQVKGLLL